jgi:hypothetical protein
VQRFGARCVAAAHALPRTVKQVSGGKVYYPSRQVRLRAERHAARNGRACVNPS